MEKIICFQRKLVFSLCLLFSSSILIVSCEANKYSLKPLNIANNSKLEDETTDPELKRNWELWAKHNISSYNIIIEGSGSFPVGIFQPVDIEVRDGTILNIEWSSINKHGKMTQEQKAIVQRQYQNYLSVEKLFEFIDFKTKDIKKNSDSEGHTNGRLKVAYNSQLGYPEQIDYVFFGSDGAMSFKIKKFEILN